MNPNDAVNGGSPIGPGFVVYERAPGQPGYDLDLALASVGKGWHGLLRALFDYLHMPEEGGTVIQVKEKYGTLRVYISGGDDRLEGIISGLEIASGTICEACGAPGRIRTAAEGRSWNLTLCDECQAKPGPLELGA